jgi:hypothetical protein
MRYSPEALRAYAHDALFHLESLDKNVMARVPERAFRVERDIEEVRQFLFKLVGTRDDDD